jgi:hypothetical protein
MGKTIVPAHCDVQLKIVELRIRPHFAVNSVVRDDVQP